MAKQFLFERSKNIYYREKDGDKDLLYKVLRNEHPDGYTLASFQNEYTILEGLSIPGVRKAIRIDRLDGLYAIVLEYLEGESLNEYLDRNKLEIKELLELFIFMTRILLDVNAAGIIHRDIKPSNFIYNEEKQILTLIDFEIATKLDIHSSFVNDNSKYFEGSLPFMSPEQTGRINRKVDHRSDLYSLGITFYTLLSGSPPFISQDPLEIIHSHIAKVPKAIHLINNSVPKAISNILSRLLEKEKENRYQSFLGLLTDLEICYKQLQETNEIKNFEIAQNDKTVLLSIPEKLYGRENELEILLKSFESSLKKKQLVLIGGLSGIGKTALIRELYKSITLKKGFFIQGKFENLQKNVPYFAILQAIKEFVDILMTKENDELESYKSEVLKAVGYLGGVITAIMPELEFLLGKQPEVPELEPVEAQNRLEYVFRQFIIAICSLDFPITIFLDDLQWVDRASIALLRAIMLDSKVNRIFMICSYRDNEVNNIHPFIELINELQNNGQQIKEIILKPISIQNIKHLCIETFSYQNDTEKALKLAELLYTKSAGNPFYTGELIKVLYHKKAIYYDSKSAKWFFSPEEIENMATSNDVVNLLNYRTQSLSSESLRIIQYASCIGSRFDLDTLKIVLGSNKTEIATALIEAITLGIITPRDDNFFLAIAFDGEEDINAECRFVHDRLQEEFYISMDEEEKLKTHLKVGRLILNSTTEEEFENNIFKITNQLNSGSKYIIEPKEKNELVKLNLRSGKKALQSAAYDISYNFSLYAIEMSQENIWEKDYELAKILYNQVIETAYLSNRFEKVKEFYTIIINNTLTPTETLSARLILLMTAMAENELQKVLKIGLEALKLVGITFPKNPKVIHIILSLVKVKLIFGRRSIESLLDLPTMSDANKIVAMQFLQKMTPAAFRSGSKLFPLIVFKQVYLSIKFGNTPASIFAYAAYGISLCGVLEDIDAGYRFGLLAMNMVSKLEGGERFHPHAIFVYNNFIRHWKEPIAVYIDDFMKGYQVAQETGYLFEAAWLAHHRCLWAFFLGRNLKKLQMQLDDVRDIFKADAAANTQALMLKQVIVNLSQTEGSSRITGDYFDESKERKLSPTEESHYQLKKLLLYYVFKEYDKALEVSQNLTLLSEALTAMPGVMIYEYYSGLTKTALAKTDNIKNKKKLIKSAYKHLQRIEKFLKWQKESHIHRYYLLKAEIYVASDNINLAKEFFDKACDAAKKQTNPIEEAITFERASEFYKNINNNIFSKTLLPYAISAYERWGAVAKLKEFNWNLNRYMEREENIIDNTVTRSYTSSRGGQELDLETIFKSVQSISSEMNLDNLIKNLMKYAVENAGANRGVLLIFENETNEDIRVRAEASIGRNPMVQIKNEKLPDFQDIPHSIIQYVIRTKKDVILEDALNDRVFFKESYVKKNKLRSILCSKIIYQGKGIGILYLENNLQEGIFSEQRLKTLYILMGQAAISIQHALLYSELEKSYEKEKKLRDSYQLFVPEQLVTSLGKNSITEVKLGDCVESELTIFFSDIRSFTSLSEKMTPKENFEFLNSYLRRVGPIIRKHNGYTDKYIGDAIMALFPKRVENGIDTAVDIQKEIQLYNKHRIKSGNDPIAVGIGLHYGSVILGTIGENQRMEGTVISDAVNLASRIEGLTKVYGASILVSQDVIMNVGFIEKYRIRRLDIVQVKGKEKSIPVYEIFQGDSEQEIELKEKTKLSFELGTEKYLQKEFENAKLLFENVLKENKNDKAALLYQKRCEHAIEYGVSKEWTGTFKMDSK